MIEISRQQLVVYAAAALAIALIGARYLQQERDPPRTAAPAAGVKVARGGGRRRSVRPRHRRGAAPGRIPGAVVGAARRGDPARGRRDCTGRPAGREPGGEGGGRAAGDRPARVPGGVPAPRAAAAATARAPPAGPISLNTATAEQLDQLEGIGPTTAQKILDWRKEHGGFRSVEDLQQISGIGPKRFESLKDKVRM